MLATDSRPPWKRPSLWGAVVCLGIFAALAAYVGSTDLSYVNEQRIAELQGQVLTPERSSALDWPQWRGPHRDGVSPATGLLPSWPEDLLTSRLRWEKPTGEGFSSVAVAGGRVYTMLQDGDSEAVVCWDVDTGQERWRYRYRCKYTNTFGDGPRSTPTVLGDRVYTVGATGLMHCLKTDPETAEGAKVWGRDLLGDFGASNLGWGVSFSPLVVGDLVYVNPGGPAGNSIAALNKDNGKTVWHRLDDQASYSSPVAGTLAGKPQIVFFTGSEVVGVSPADGTPYWRHPWKTDQGINVATPILVGQYVFVSSAYNKGCCLLKIEPDGDGQRAEMVYANRKLRAHFSTPVFYQDHLYGFDDAFLVCMDFRTGEQKWRQRGFDKGSLIVADGRLIILGENGVVAQARATPAGFQLASPAPDSEAALRPFSRTPCRSAPALADGRLYIRNQERLLCLDLRVQQK
jgi:outer membrane protein assembly factor BamB